MARRIYGEYDAYDTFHLESSTFLTRHNSAMRKWASSFFGLSAVLSIIETKAKKGGNHRTYIASDRLLGLTLLRVAAQEIQVSDYNLNKSPLSKNKEDETILTENGESGRR